MKIYISHVKESDFLDGLYKPIKESELYSKHEFFFPHDSNELVNTKDIIKNSALVIAEVSQPATGQGIELGWANILNVPIVCIYKDGCKIAGSLKYISDTFIVYSDQTDLIKKLSEYLNKI